ncbi:cobalamin-binding protein [Thermus composti]|uniref:ABC transporter substrate-binding protein n=1 Tax=Thermus composti TaxID=532059 RepID=A0ABV6PYR9_9DEIN|nr:ABC transporter substrate-binding protein [Thermus composti]GGM93160.1 cobalamin-binding protein [Thermus composti]
MRAVSLVPSGTLLLRALGVEPVGVSHSCPNPTGLPVLTESLIPQGLSQEEIDRKVREAYARGLSLYRVRTERLQALAPDLLVTQGVCEVCAPTPGEVGQALAFLPRRPEVVVLQGTRLRDLFRDLLRLGEALGREGEAKRLARRLEASLQDLPPPLEPPPGVVFLEWLDPPYLGGHWVAEAVALAGGRYLGPGPGAPSRRARPEELPEAQVVFLAFCGFGLPEALQAVEAHLARGGWLGGYLRGKQAFLLDAGPFHALTPLTVEGVARLARLLRGEGAEGAYALAP